MRADPVRQAAGPSGFGIRVVAGAEHGDEYVRRAYLAGGRIDHWDGVAGTIDEGLLAGAVVLPQHHVQMARPIAILLAEPAVMSAVGVLLAELLPEELERDALGRFQLLVNPEQIGLLLGRRAALAYRLGGRRRESAQPTAALSAIREKGLELVKFWV